MQVTPRAVLWDLDGTLVDSEEYHWRAWREAMAAEGVAITREQFLDTFGQRNDTIVPRLLARPADEATVARIAEAKEVRYRERVRAGGLRPLAGASEWVERLKQDGWLQAIASSAPRLNMEVVLEAIGLAGRFDAMAPAEDVRRGKPDPEVFLTAAARLKVPVNRCVVVEDSPAGIEAAGRAGMRSIDVRSRPLSDLPRGSFDELI